MKKLLSLVLAVVLLTGCMPGAAMAAKKNNQMNEGVPVWTEETVSQYILDYIRGDSMTRLWNYYDLQIRRYLPPLAFETLLTELEFLTGEFQTLGSYRSFEEPENELKTHVLHLCMEKQDLDMYFTHKNKENDWEVMALEFVPAEEEIMPVDFQADVAWSESAITVGREPYVLNGMLTMPKKASAEAPVPACVLVHDFDGADMNATIGKTQMFRDFAELMGNLGIAVLRYDKRTYAYPDAKLESVWEEVVEDAILGGQLLQSMPEIDASRVIVVGLGLGGMLTPRIASQSEGVFDGMIIIGSKTDSLLRFDYDRQDGIVSTMTEEERDELKQLLWNLEDMSEEEVRTLTILGRNGYYYWDAVQYDALRLLRKMELPVYVAHGRQDPTVSEDDGRRAYSDELGLHCDYAVYNSFRGLNHILMDDLTTNREGKPEYQVETHLNKQAGRALAAWILNGFQEPAYE